MYSRWAYMDRGIARGNANLDNAHYITQKTHKSQQNDSP
jgi:hypothetical protein